VVKSPPEPPNQVVGPLRFPFRLAAAHRPILINLLVGETLNPRHTLAGNHNLRYGSLLIEASIIGRAGLVFDDGLALARLANNPGFRYVSPIR